MPAKADDFIKMFEEEGDCLPSAPILKDELPGVPALVAPVCEDWQNDPVPVKIDKIKAAFLNGKTAEEISIGAALMQVGDFIELAAKFDKQAERGPIQITSIRIELPPRESYCEGEVVEVELPR